MVNWGFLTFLPTFLRDAGYDGSRVSELLFLSAVIAVPGAFLVAWLYGMWSSKKGLILYAGVTAAAVAAFAFLNPATAASQGTLLVVLVVVLLIASGGAISMLSPYAAEVFPTHLRGSGSGLAAGSSKLRGIVGPPLVASMAALSPGLALPALVTAGPVAVAAVVLVLFGVETSGRRLEELGDPAVAATGAGVEGR
jgi:putative MFS transporter